MGFVKVVKNKAYYKRYQVKYRRRREGKTDYYARKRLTIQDKNKYNTPRYRLVVRLSNRQVTCQIISAKLEGDFVIAAAYSSELPAYGLPAAIGLTNWAACYATGLLVARRALTSLNLADTYKGVEKADGEEYYVEPVDEQPRPFRVVLDVGLHRTTTGARVFGALKGAIDGGLDIPYSCNRFPGSSGKKKEEGDPETVRKYIFGGHVASYMRMLKEEEPEKYEKHFSQFIKAGVDADALQGLYEKVHTAIRKNPVHTKSNRKAPAVKRTRKAKLNAAMKHGRAKVKLMNLMASR
jgi:large subunit ribosomal protein L5e